MLIGARTGARSGREDVDEVSFTTATLGSVKKLIVSGILPESFERIVVDWGDGVVESFVSGDEIAHEFPQTSTSYAIVIKGNITSYGSLTTETGFIKSYTGTTVARVDNMVIKAKNLKYIGLSCFRNRLGNGSSLILPECIESFGQESFYGFRYKKLIIKSKVKTIPRSCFGAATTYNNCLFVELPETVESIEAYGFFRCFQGTEKVIVRALTPPVVASANSINFPIATFFVPDESVEAYKNAAVWETVSDRIMPISQIT